MIVTRVLGHRRRMVLALVSLVILAGAAPARAAVVPLTAFDFGGATLIDFGTNQTLAPINGQVISGVTFGYTINGIASTDAIIGGEPGITNNITPANVVNELGNDGAVLSLLFPSLQTRFGYGYAVAAEQGVPLPNATTVRLFDASNALVGTLSGNALPDPSFPGGFMGIGSTIAFLRAEVTFSTQGAAFAFDNARFSDVPVPEPGTLTLVGLGAALAVARRMRRQTR
jgi:PEP-CTERM motif